MTDSCRTVNCFQELNMGESCPRYDELLLETMKTHAIKQEEKQNKVLDISEKRC